MIEKSSFDIKTNQDGSRKIKLQCGEDTSYEINLSGKIGWKNAYTTAEILKSLEYLENSDVELILEQDVITESRIPVISLYKKYPQPGKMPVLFMLHGFETSKEKMVRYAVNFAAQGVFTVMQDAPDHGERFDPDHFHNAYRLDKDPMNGFKNRLILMGKYTEETGKVMEWYRRSNNLDFSRIGITGVSMGATVSLYLASKNPGIKTVAAFIPVVGFENLFAKNLTIQDGFLTEIRKIDPLFFLQAPVNASVFILSGSEDRIVGNDSMKILDNDLKKTFEKRTGDYSYKDYRGTGHDISDEMLQDAVKWMREKL